MPERRTPAQVRSEIEAEREQLAGAIASLSSGTKQTARQLSAFAAGAGVVVLAGRRLLRRRRR